MRLPIITALFVAATMVATSPSLAQSGSRQDGLTITGSSRVRYEMIAGQARAGFNDSDDLLNIRTTLAATWSADDWKVMAEVYDSRAYLADAGTPLSTSEVNALEVVQAYVARRVSLDGGARLDVQAGRFLLNLGSRRLVAADDYRNTTNSYTGVRADWSAPGGWSATGIYTLPQQRRPDDRASLDDHVIRPDREGFDLVLWGGLLARADALGGATAEASFFHLGERDTDGRPTRDRSLNTFGGRIIREPKAGSVDFEVEGFLQRGRVSTSAAPNAPRQGVSAHFIHLEAGYTWPGGWKPRLSFEYDRASGDRSGGRFGRFDTLFGMRRAELAPSGLYNAFGRTNFSSPAVRVEVAPSKRVDAFLSFRPIWLAEKTDAFSTTAVRDASGRSGKHAGEQLDARVRYWAIPDRLRLEVDGVFLAKGRFLREAPNAPRGGDTRYLSLNATIGF